MPFRSHPPGGRKCPLQYTIFPQEIQSYFSRAEITLKEIESSYPRSRKRYREISQLRKNQLVKVKFFTDGYYEELPGRVDSVDEINKDLKIYTGVMNAIGKELPTIIAFEDILEIGVNMT